MTVQPCGVDGMDACVYCWQIFGGEGRGVNPNIAHELNFTHGPVVHAETGNEYEYVGESEGGTPLAHWECYKEYAELTDNENTKLTKWSL